MSLKEEKMMWWITAIGVFLVVTWFFWIPRFEFAFAQGLIGSIMSIVGAKYLDEHSGTLIFCKKGFTLEQVSQRLCEIQNKVHDGCAGCPQHIWEYEKSPSCSKTQKSAPKVNKDE